MPYSLMNKKLSLYIFGLIYPLSALALTADAAGIDGKPMLWKQAVLLMEKQKNMVPGRIETRAEVLDRKGRVDEVTEHWLELVDDGNGGYKQELRKALRNGIDVTEKELAEMKEKESEKKGENKKSMSFNLGENPLNPEKQDRVEVISTEQRQKLFGRTCIRFDFVMADTEDMDKKRKKSKMKGMVWIDEYAGCPVKVEYTHDPLPRFTKKFWTILLYDTDTSGAWVVNEARMEGEGGMLFIRKGFRATMKFTDYWASTANPAKN